jgi:cell division inhibitor SepF
VSNIFGKLRDLVGLNHPADYEYDEMEGEEYQSLYQSEHPHIDRGIEAENHTHQPETEIGSAMNTSLNNVVVPGTSKWWGSVAEVIVMEPRVFEEMPQIVQALKDRKSVVLNLTMMDPDQAQRAVDFVAGATFTIDGHQERIGESIFLFTPNCVQVSTQSGGVNEVTQEQVHTVRPSASVWTNEPAVSRLAQ